MKGKLNNDYLVIKVLFNTPYNDLNFRESSMLGLLLSVFDTSNHKPKDCIRWNRKALGLIFNYGPNVLDRILKSLKEKEYIDSNSKQNKEAVFRLLPKGLEAFNVMYKPSYQVSSNTQ